MSFRHTCDPVRRLSRCDADAADLGAGVRASGHAARTLDPAATHFAPRCPCVSRISWRRFGAVLGLGAPACSSSNSSVPNVCIPVTEAPEGGMVSDGGAGLLLDGSCVVVVGGGPPVEPGQSSVSGASGSVAGSGVGTLPGGGTSGAIGISGDDGGFGSSGNIGSSGLGSTGSSGVGSSGSTGSSGLGSSGSGLGSSGSIGGVGTIGGIGSSGNMAVLPGGPTPIGGVSSGI